MKFKKRKGSLDNVLSNEDSNQENFYNDIGCYGQFESPQQPPEVGCYGEINEPEIEEAIYEAGEM